MAKWKPIDMAAMERARRVEAAADELAEALVPYAALAKHHAADAPEWGPFDSVTAQVSIGYLRDATAALAAYQAAKGDA